MSDPRTFYTQQLPIQWNRALREQERAAEAARRVLEGMRAVNATLRVDVQGEGGGTFYLNVANGVLAAADSAAHAPFLTLVQDRPAFERIVAEAGDSALGFLGGLSGLSGEMKLTQARVEQLRELAGCVRFELTGDGGFALLAHFGGGLVPGQPNATIRVDGDAYRALRGGELNPQEAFVTGKIQVEGDMQLAMSLALAALAVD